MAREVFVVPASRLKSCRYAVLLFLMMQEASDILLRRTVNTSAPDISLQVEHTNDDRLLYAF